MANSQGGDVVKLDGHRSRSANDDVEDPLTRVLKSMAASNTVPAQAQSGVPASSSGPLTAKSKRRIAPFSHYASLSKVGYVPFNPNKVNQDRGVEIVKFGGHDEKAFFGVFDGHGALGHEVSSFLVNELPKFFLKQSNLDTDPHEAITRAFVDCNVKLASSNIDCSFSGSTCIVVYLAGNKLYSCNAGDSRAVLARATADGRLQAIPLSSDQKPEREDEKKRILEHKGRVEACKGVRGEDIGPPRVWLSHQDVPGLAMCLKEGTLVARADGSAIACEQIQAGMQLMGDGQSVTVTSAETNLSKEMYTIRAAHGMEYSVTAEHRLTVRWKDTGDLSEVTAKELASQWDYYSTHTTAALLYNPDLHIMPLNAPTLLDTTASTPNGHLPFASSMQLMCADGSCRPLASGDVCTTLYDLPHTFPSLPAKHTPQIHALSISLIQKASAALGINITESSGHVVQTSNTDSLSSHPHDLLSSLQLGAKTVVLFGGSLKQRWSAVEPPNVLAERHDGLTHFSKLMFNGRVVFVVDCPYPCDFKHLPYIIDAVRLAHQLSNHLPLTQIEPKLDALQSAAWLSISKDKIDPSSPQRIISLEVDGNHRYVLADGSITHNSRSFGDLIAASVGVIAKPEIWERDVTEQDKFFVLASDGVWEFMTNQEVVDLISQASAKGGAEEAVKALVDEATKRWHAEEEVVDDITATVVFL